MKLTKTMIGGGAIVLSLAALTGLGFLFANTSGQAESKSSAYGRALSAANAAGGEILATVNGVDIPRSYLASQREYTGVFPSPQGLAGVDDAAPGRLRRRPGSHFLVESRTPRSAYLLHGGHATLR